MPVWNGQEFLAEAIESILSQTYRKFELLVADDASQDDSYQIAKAYAKKYPNRVKVFHLRKQTNEAGNGAVNAVLKHARGEYIARMDADDVAHPKRLEKQVAYMEGHPKVMVLGTQARVIDGQGKVTGQKVYPTRHEEIVKAYAVVHPMIHPSVMVRRSMLPDKNRLYQMKFGINDDYYTFFGLQKIGRFANLPQKLLDYRVHGKNASLVQLKKRYKNISNIRKAAVADFGYKMNWKAKGVVMVQGVIVAMLPELVLTQMYLMMRGMAGVKWGAWKEWLPSVNLRTSRRLVYTN